MTDAATRRERRETRTTAPTPGPKRRETPRRPLWQTILTGVAVIMVALFVAVTLTGPGAEEMTETGAVEISGDALAPIPQQPGTADPAVGQPAPEASGLDFGGNDVGLLAEDQGTLLVFMAHWCNVCQREIPVVVDHFGDNRPEGVRIVGVPTSTDRTQGNYPPSAWLEAEEWPFGLMVDSAESELGQAYGVTAYPAFVAVGPDGEVRARVSGAVPPEGLDQLVDLARG